MPNSTETSLSTLARSRRVATPTRVIDLDALPGAAACTTRQVAALSGFAEITLKVWRRAGDGRGPRVTRIEGKPRYLVSDVRAWMGAGR